MIKDFIIGERITDFMLLKQIELKVSESSSRLAMILGDRTGEIDAILWNNAENIKNDLAQAEVVKVQALVGSYRQKPQLTVEKIRAAESDEYDLDDLKRSAGLSLEELTSEIDSLLESLQDKYLKELMLLFRSDEDSFNLFLSKPAGKRFHHDYHSGLANHSLSLARLVDAVCGNYPNLDRDLLICGAFFHDIGKIIEFEGEIVFDYSDAGRLLGHITMGDHYVANLISQIEDFPESTKLKLRHLILSHHGTGEYGSPVTPKTREAYVLHNIDEIDSKLDAIDKIAEKSTEKWSEWIRPLETFLYFD